jgi:P22 coat protein - gene protein 5
VADNFEVVRKEHTADAMEILSNNCVVPAFVGREEEQYFQQATKIGDSLDMLRPIKTMGGTGQSFEPEGLVRTTVPLQVAFWVKYNFMYSSREDAMFLDNDKKKNYLKPGAIHMANTIDLLMLQYIAATSPNWVGTPGTPPTTTDTYASAQTKLNQLLAPFDDRVVVFNSAFNQGIVKANSTLFNPQQVIGKEHLTGKVGRAFDFDFMNDEQVPFNTAGTYVTVGTVNGAGQQGSSIVTGGWGAGTTSLAGNERFTYAGCYAVNPDSRLQTGNVLAQWQLTAPAVDVAGALTMQIFPAMITNGPYQNCSNSPANGAVITMAAASGIGYTTAVAMQKGAYTAAFIELEDVSKYGAMCTVMTDPDTKISMRCIWQWNSSGPYAGNTTVRMESIFGIGSKYSENFACAILG